MVSNLINKNGRAVANQFVISEMGKIAFQSYNSRVCEITNDTITFGRDWDYSRTTMKHLNTFLSDNNIALEGADNIRKAIKNGRIASHKVVYNDNMR